MADATAHEATIHLIIEKGADVNELAECPEHPLYAAAAHYSETVVQTLIDRAAFIDESTSKNKDAIKAAAGQSLK